MSVTHHGLLIKLTRLGAFNCYLLHEDDGFTLIDTGLPGSANSILKTASTNGGEIKRILLTHAHMDHVGSLDALCPHLPDAEVIIGEREAALMAGDMRLLADEPQTKPKGGYPSIKTPPTHIINDGDMVGSLQAVFSPGHTPGHMAYLDTRDQTLIAGDALTTVGRVTVTGQFNWRFPFPAFATWDKPTALKSAQKLLGLQPSRLVVGHGSIVASPIQPIQAAIAHAQRHLK